MPTMTTVNTTSNTAWNKSFYDRKLLNTAKTKLVHQQFGQKRSIPRNSGKTVEYRRYELFGVDTAGLELTEGVKPTAQTINQTTVTSTVKQYGAYVELSDLLNLTAYDQVVSDAAGLLGEQLGTCIDWVTRDAMRSGASVQYAGGGANTLSIAKTNVLTLSEVRKAVRTLKNMKARPFTDGGDHFVCIISPSQAYDLQNDSLWKDIAIHVDPKRAYTGEIGRCLGVAFVESTECAVSAQSVLNKVNAATSSTATFVLKNAPTAAEIKYLSKGGNKIKIGTSEYTLASTGSLTESGGVYTVKLSANASLAADAIVYSEDAGAVDSATKKGTEIHHALIFGADAYGVIDVAGSGAMRTIIKPAGAAGSADPLDQVSTVGAKVLAYSAKVLNSLWIIDLQTGVSD